MGSSFPTGGFGGAGHTDGMWQAMEQLRAKFEKRVGSRMGRGDVRQAVLSLRAEQPMHGYQIIHEIEERSGGTWKPSAGSVYPTLQLLADEGLISAEESNGRKTYSRTDAVGAGGCDRGRQVHRPAQGRNRVGPGGRAGGPHRVAGADQAGRGRDR